MATKVSKKVIINVSIEEAEQASSLYATSSNSLDRLEAKMNKEIIAIKDKYQEEVQGLNADKKEQAEILEVFAREQKGSWGKKKSMELLHCTLSFRTGNPAVVKSKKFTWEAILTLMKKNKALARFIRTKEEINKELILAEKNEAVLNMLKEDCYLSIGKEEAFNIVVKEEVINTK